MFSDTLFQTTVTFELILHHFGFMRHLDNVNTDKCEAESLYVKQCFIHSFISFNCIYFYAPDKIEFLIEPIKNLIAHLFLSVNKKSNEKTEPTLNIFSELHLFKNRCESWNI